jgi:hypothetical protein
LETHLTHNLADAKILKFSCIGASVSAKPDEEFGAFQFAIVIRRDVRNKIGWMFQAYRFVS